jgi:hypothetical protein
MNSDVNSTDFELDKLLIKIFNKNIINLIKYIHLKYPKEFTKEIRDTYILNLESIEVTPLTNTKNVRLKIKVNKKIIMKKFHNTGIIINKNKERSNELSSQSNNEKCIARTWGNGRMKKIKIENIENIENIIYGIQCSRPKKTGDYCFQHHRNNHHGDYNKPVSTEMIKNFNKYGKYM